ncbi:hypothetical protein [Nocardia sp. NRRL S-836]|uniref:hypothetical protein n=1 Tax=Nocardia sp. NRRL S-836 TaxID=1519492 RepID=UPI0012F9FB60|nr:hypothetical protein [Nocardia sp. NRRL S-836]
MDALTTSVGNGKHLVPRLWKTNARREPAESGRNPKNNSDPFGGFAMSKIVPTFVTGIATLLAAIAIAASVSAGAGANAADENPPKPPTTTTTTETPDGGGNPWHD